MAEIELNLPDVGADRNEWGGKLNTAITTMLAAVNSTVANVVVRTVSGVDHLIAVHVDDSETDLGPLPVAPGGTDAGVAGYIGDPESATNSALSAQTVAAVSTPGDVRTAVDGRVTSALAAKPNLSTGVLSRSTASTDSRQVVVRDLGDTTDGLFDWRHNSASKYLFHLTMGANTTANAYAIAIGLDDGLGRGILLANKKTGIGITLNQQSSITSATAYGMQGQQNSNLAPVVSLEAYAADAAPLMVLRSSVNTPASTTKLLEATGQPAGVYTSWGSISAQNGAINWNAPINLTGSGLFVNRTSAGDITFLNKLTADGTDIANYRSRFTANGALTWSDGAGMSTGPSLSRNGTALQLNNVFQSNGGYRWGVAGLMQTTVGAAGAAAALPATPSKYFKVQDETGTTFVIPGYAAA